MFKRSARYFTLGLTLVVLTASARIAPAQPTDPPCTDPSTGCVVGGTDPQPGNLVGNDGPNVVGGTDPQPGSMVGDDGSDVIVSSLFYYGLG